MLLVCGSATFVGVAFSVEDIYVLTLINKKQLSPLSVVITHTFFSKLYYILQRLVLKMHWPDMTPETLVAMQMNYDYEIH